jgi:hypothetical protein
MSHPPVLTPERIDAMISGVAEVCFAKVQEAGERMTATDDMTEYEKGGRTLNTACRNLRLVIVIKQRFDRDQLGLTAEARTQAETERKAAERQHADAVGRHHKRVSDHFGRVLWNEYDEDDAQEIYDDLNEYLSDLAEDDPAFLETPVETLIARLTEKMGIGQEEPDDDDEGGESEDEASPVIPPETPLIGVSASEPVPEPSPDPPPEAEASDPAVEDAPLTAAPPAPPRIGWPEPGWPEPYIPPWEKLKPGQIWPGSSGW